MINVEDSIVINRPVEEVFAFVADQENALQWQEGLLEVRRTTDGPLGVGTKHTIMRKFMGRRVEATNEYVEYEPNKKIAFTGRSGPAHFEVAYLTESVAEGTRLTCQMQMEQRGLFGLMDSLIAGSLKRDFEANFRDLKALLESRAEQISS